MIEHLLTPLISEKFINDERYRNGHLRVINALPETRILGVHIPELKMLAKSIAKQDDALELITRFEQEFLKGDLCLEEKLVWGLLINAVKLPESVKLILLKAFIPAMDNFAVCDTICCNIKWIKDKNALWEFSQPYFVSDKEFDVRFAVIMAMIFFLDSDSFPLVQLKLESLYFDRIYSEYLSPKEAKMSNEVRGVAKGERPYYVRVAVAWLLATALAKILDQTRAYMNSCHLTEDVSVCIREKLASHSEQEMLNLYRLL